jgi:hypothetical protein
MFCISLPPALRNTEGDLYIGVLGKAKCQEMNMDNIGGPRSKQT